MFTEKHACAYQTGNNPVVFQLIVVKRRLWYIHIKLLSIKDSELLIDRTTWMNLKCILLRKMPGTKDDILYVSTNFLVCVYCHLYPKAKTLQIENRSVVARKSAGQRGDYNGVAFRNILGQ